MVPFVIYNFPFIICLYSVVCGELKREHERENDKIEIMNDIGARVGKENTYVFTCDFRMGAVQLANSLRE